MGENLESLSTLRLAVKYMVTVPPLAGRGENWELRGYQAELAEVLEGRPLEDLRQAYDRIQSLPHDASVDLALADYQENFLE
jgi:hypothetical protein